MSNFEININSILKELNLSKNNFGTSSGKDWVESSGTLRNVFSPVDGNLISSVFETDEKNYKKIISLSKNAFNKWRKIPAPKRGEIVRQIGNKLREKKDALGALVSYEMGKSIQEGLGEVQEMIDICDFAVGLSRQLHGFTMHSERPMHRMYEQYHPIGLVGIISAFNFPVAVWAWNTALAWICGDVCIWKPSEKAPLCGVACQKIMAEVLNNNNLHGGICSIVIGNADLGKMMSADKRIPLISATGSTRMGKSVGKVVGERLGKSLLELGGNNAVILTPNADLKMVIPALVFGAVGTTGQRCTSTRRLIIHESIYSDVKAALVSAYGQLKIGDPLDESNHVGPLIDVDAVEMYLQAIDAAKKEGGQVIVEGGQLKGAGYESNCYVKPVIIEAKNEFKIVQHETFAPILYLIKYDGDVNQAIKIQNDVPQGLSSAIMTTDMREQEAFLSHKGSDCGIANVNIGTSGAEIGGAFGGEKETGGGRESGSDAWKVYMRRQTNTINWGTSLPLAQGIKFEL